MKEFRVCMHRYNGILYVLNRIRITCFCYYSLISDLEKRIKNRYYYFIQQRDGIKLLSLGLATFQTRKESHDLILIRRFKTNRAEGSLE